MDILRVYCLKTLNKLSIYPWVTPPLPPVSGKSELGESPKATLLSLASVWVFASWDCRRLHTSNTPVSLAIRTTSTTSALTGTYCCHPCPLTLVVTRKANRMLLFYGNQFGYRLVKDFAPWATRKGGVYRRSRNHNRHVGRTLQCGLLRCTRLSVRFKVRRMIRRFIGVLELGFGLVNL